MSIWGARVLLVEHDEQVLEVASRALREKGADVIIVPDAGVALGEISRNRRVGIRLDLPPRSPNDLLLGTAGG
jgi:DNA-binding response OmpR family regulator